MIFTRSPRMEEYRPRRKNTRKQTKQAKKKGSSNRREQARKAKLLLNEFDFLNGGSAALESKATLPKMEQSGQKKIYKISSIDMMEKHRAYQSEANMQIAEAQLKRAKKSGKKSKPKFKRQSSLPDITGPPIPAPVLQLTKNAYSNSMSTLSRNPSLHHHALRQESFSKHEKESGIFLPDIHAITKAGSIEEHSAKAGNFLRTAKHKFSMVDKDASDKLDPIEFKNFIRGTKASEQISKMSIKEQRKFFKDAFGTADANKDGRIDMDEFIKFYQDFTAKNAEESESKQASKAATVEKITRDPKPSSKKDANSPADAPTKTKLKRHNSVFSAAYSIEPLTDIIMHGKVDALKAYVENYRKANNRRFPDLSKIGGLPTHAIIVAVEYKQLEIASYLCSEPKLVPSISAASRAAILHSCAEGDAVAVSELVHSLYHKEAVQADVHHALLAEDVEMARISLQQQHRDRVASDANANANATYMWTNRGAHPSQVHWFGVPKAYKGILIASAKGDVLMLQKVIKSDIINCQDEQGMTPLLHASVYGNPKALELLYKFGADPLKQNIYQRSALSVSAKNDNYENIKLAIMYGAAPSLWLKDNTSMIPIDKARLQYTKEYLRKFMRDYHDLVASYASESSADPDADIDGGGKVDHPPTPVAAKPRAPSKVKKKSLLLPDSAAKDAITADDGDRDPEFTGPISRKVFYKAEKKSRNPLLDKIGEAARVGNLRFLEVIVKTKRRHRNRELTTLPPETLHSHDRYGMTPLMHAVANNHGKCARFLVKHGIANNVLDVKTKSKFMLNTVLHFAHQLCDNRKLFSWLYNRGFAAAKDIRNREGMKAKDCSPLRKFE